MTAGTKPLTGAQVAELAGISQSAIAKVKDAADSPRRGPGGYDCATVGRWLARRALASAGKSEDDALDLTREQAALAKARRLALETEAKVRAGELVEIAVVHNDVVRCAHNFRDAMLSVPGRIAAQLAGLDDEREIDRRLTGIIREELTRIAESADLATPAHE